MGGKTCTHVLMKTRKTMSSSMPVATDRRGDRAKLVSLLALATGATAIPQASNADIIFTDLSSNPIHVGFSTGDIGIYPFSVPGAAFGFSATSTIKTKNFGLTTSRFRTVFFDRFSGASAHVQRGANGFASPQAKSAAWNNGLGLAAYAAMGVAVNGKTAGDSTFYNQTPANGYDQKYLGWQFKDGGALRYGWVEVSLGIGTGTGPRVTIYGYAYDNSGAQITMGAVPEPAPMAILAIGALTLGAKGVRAWRHNRTRTSES